MVSTVVRRQGDVCISVITYFLLAPVRITVLRLAACGNYRKLPKTYRKQKMPNSTEILFELISCGL